MFTLVTWNVNSLAARRERVEAFLKKNQPDVVCFQEIKCVNEKVDLNLFSSLGYEIAVHGQKTYNGVAIASRHPLTKIVRGLGQEDIDHEARAIGATVLGVRVFCVYVPNGREVGSEHYLYKLR